MRAQCCRNHASSRLIKPLESLYPSTHWFLEGRGHSDHFERSGLIRDEGRNRRTRATWTVITQTPTVNVFTPSGLE